jgi:DNA polymerase III epsilon subunit-like protein
MQRKDVRTLGRERGRRRVQNLVPIAGTAKRGKQVAAISARSASDPENYEASPMKFIAIDFETATCSADSACAIGIVSIEKGRITKSEHRLIRPPRKHFTFSYLHGISWADVKAEPTFIKVWEGLTPLWEGADYFLAHNAPFDRNVLASGLLFGRWSMSAGGAIYMHGSNRALALEYSTDKPASRMCPVRNSTRSS